MCRDSRYNVLYLILAIRMVAEGHKKVAEGWAMFEAVCNEAGTGELPQLLRSVRSATTPPMGPPTTPVKAAPSPMNVDEPEAGPAEPAESPIHPHAVASWVKTEGEGFISEPVMIRLEGHKYNYGCPNCSIAPTRSKRGMDAHIRSVHTKIPLLCAYCEFTSYNMDSLQRHEKTHV